MAKQPRSLRIEIDVQPQTKAAREEILRALAGTTHMLAVDEKIAPHWNVRTFERDLDLERALPKTSPFRQPQGETP